MEKDRGFKIIALVALVLAVVGVSIGFAAFARDLTINVEGDVTPVDSFSIQFSDANGGVSRGIIQATTGSGSATIRDGLTITDVLANFQRPGDTAVFNFYVTNTSEYIAYLKSITLSQTAASCTATDGSAIETVQNGSTACADMDMQFEIGGSTAGFGETTSIIASNSIAAKVGETYTSVPVTLTLTYGGSAYVDGGIKVDFGSISLGYSTSNL